MVDQIVWLSGTSSSPIVAAPCRTSDLKCPHASNDLCSFSDDRSVQIVNGSSRR